MRLMTEILERPGSMLSETDRVHDLFLEKTLLRLEAMCENFDSGGWTTAIKKSLVSNAFNIKNEAHAMGYRLLEKTADSFCGYVDGIRYPTENQRVVMAKHLETMQSIAINNVEGDGGEIGSELFRYLQLLIQKFQE